ncbi:hypothetical protein C8R46DRAFT_1212439 [Mycena filopes]|nr:hypothetical protein C8R46DRAFT_1212439 [Mycena filopes]
MAMSGLQNWPLSIPLRIHILPMPLFSPDCVVFVSGAGPSHLALEVDSNCPDIQKVLPPIDSINDTEIDKENLSWTLLAGHNQSILFKLHFPTLRVLEAFLFALCFVRYIHAKELSALSFTKAHNAILTAANDRYLQDLTGIFVDLRTTNAEVNCPIHRLPVEVVSEIFLLCPSDTQPDRFGSPLVLLQVCAGWRTVAIDTSGLWRTASFVLGRSFLAHDKNHHVQMASWLARAKAPTATLSIAVDESYDVLHKAFRMARYNPSLFASVRILRISSPQSQLPNLLNGGPGSCMPALESLSLITPRWNLLQRPLHRSTVRDQRVLPAGLRLSTRRRPMLLTALPWSQLRTLIIQINIRFSAWLAIFSQCTSLRTARFVVWSDGPHYPTVAVIFPHLETLSVTFRGICETGFFDHLAFPVLRELHIIGLPPAHPRVPLIPRFASLRTLSVEIPGLHPTLLERVVRSHPNLRQLAFIIDQYPAIYAPLFQLLRREYRLHTLTISTSIGDISRSGDLRRLTGHLMTWAIEQATLGCEFRLFGNTTALEAFKNVLLQAQNVEGKLKLYPAADDFDDPFGIFPYSRLIFFRVRHRPLPLGHW